MRRWAWVRAGLLLVAFLAVAAGVLLAVVKREPDFYAQAVAVAPRAEDPAVASDTQTRLGELVTALTIPQTAPGDWEVSFTPDELNAFLREDDDHVMLLRPRLEGYSDERVSVRGDRLLLAARYGDGFWSTVVSVELKAWLVAGEPNTFAVELVAVRAGLLPLPKRWVMDPLSEYAVRQKAELTWYRYGANPVAVCRLRVNQPQPDLLLQTLDIKDDRVTVGGKGLIGP